MSEGFNVRRIDTEIEINILHAMTFSSAFLGRLHSAGFQDSLFDNEYSRIIASWCLEFFERYEKAPGITIESTFLSWARSVDSEKHVESMRRVVQQLTDRAEDSDSLNVDFLLDEAEEYFNRRKLTVLAQDIQAGLVKGSSEEIESTINSYHRLEVSQSAGIDPLRDMSALRQVFEEGFEPLIQFPGALGNMINHCLTRDKLIGIQATEKTGKSLMMLEMIYRAMRTRRSVAYFDMGDMSQREVLLRLYSRITGLPSLEKHLGSYNRPVNICRNEDGEIEVETKSVELDTLLTFRKGRRAAKEFLERVVKVKDRSIIRVANFPNGTVNTSGIRSHLESWNRVHGFVPDVIVIDYADIMAPEDTRKDERGRVNDTWKALRRLSQEWHCLLITATQADAKAYTGRIQTMSNFSEDKRKNAHVNGMLGLNQTEEEKEREILRVNWIALRDSEFSARRCCYVLQALRMGRAYVGSVM